jgi:SAM-dependent methyltransferase
VQTVVDEEWRRAADEVYEAYDIYAAAEGAEQKVAAADGFSGRSEVLVGRWGAAGDLPQQGHLLDVGCGNGSFLRAFGRLFPCWELSAVETSDRYLPRLREMDGFRNFFLVGRDEVEGTFDAISLVHVLEHLAAPAEHLARLRGHARDGGALLVEVPGWLDNPFALMISDHASHFTEESLEAIISRAGWTPTASSSEWVPKELSLAATKGAPADGGYAAGEPDLVRGRLQQAVDWLGAVSRQAAEVAGPSPSFGLFGTAIAATWLLQALPGHVRFLVDEDPDRIGRTHLGLPILAPSEVPEGSDVFVGLSPLLSHAIAARLETPGRRYHAVYS